MSKPVEDLTVEDVDDLLTEISLTLRAGHTISPIIVTEIERALGGFRTYIRLVAMIRAYKENPEVVREWCGDAFRVPWLDEILADRDRVKEAVRAFLAAEGHDLCWINRSELAVAVGLPNTKPETVTETEFAIGCLKYRREIYGRLPMTDLQMLQARLDELEAERREVMEKVFNLMDRKAEGNARGRANGSQSEG